VQRFVDNIATSSRWIEPKTTVSGSVAGKSGERGTRFRLRSPGRYYLSNAAKVSKVSAVLRRSLLITVVVLITGGVAPADPAAAGADPATFINNFSKQLRVVSSCTFPEQKLAGFRELFREDFDISGLSRFVLGRFWRIFTPSEQQEFLGLFENLVVLTYSERLLEYADGGGGLRAIGSRPEPDGAIVSSELTRETGSWVGRGPMLQPIRVDWRLSARDGTYKISDVVIDGLSMAANGRSQLEGVVQRNGGRAQAILAVMRQQTASASAR
jgi:phospholipid transport system substrate-binding protein